MHGHAVGSMNHWVVPIGSGKHDQVADDLIERLGEGATSEQMLFATYLSMHQSVVRSIVDDDCALDVMCLMLGKPRTLASRKEIRYECSRFARRHVRNRALISMLNTTEK